MSFFYDSNAFWTNHQPANLRIFVLNNGGGDIFNIIPGRTQPAERQVFCSKTILFCRAHLQSLRCRLFHSGFG